MAVTVKPLEWVHEHSTDYGRGIIGWYKISGGWPDGRFRLEGPHGSSFHVSVDDAKASAQADYDPRVLSAIVPEPPS